MLQSLFVKGEVSGCKYHSSGHIYFTLKDEKAAMACVMFAGNRSGLSFRLTDGQQVVVFGSMDVYERDGKYQMYAKQITLDGSGLLYEKYEMLKKELAEAGMFDPMYKRPIPKYIKTLGVVTADTGAAVRDIIQIATRRNPYVQIILYPAIVQGDAAAPSIIKGIRALEAYGVDVMIVGRGGGSIEDLWAFNEREVAEAVFNCSVPIISAVGHETDTTIIDYVSDLRAPTPSAAAELAVYDVRRLFEVIDGYREGLCRAMEGCVADKRRQLLGYQTQLRYLSPMSRIREKKTYLLHLEEKLGDLMQSHITKRRHRLALYIEQMKGLSPISKLNSGFSYVADETGKNIRSVENVQVGEKIRIHVSDGCMDAQVTGIQKGE